MAFWYKRRRVVREEERKKSDEYRLGYLVDGSYDGYNECASLKFLDPKTQEIFVWRDNTGHLSYLITDAEEENIRDMLSKRFERIEEVVKYASIADKIV